MALRLFLGSEHLPTDASNVPPTISNQRKNMDIEVTEHIEASPETVWEMVADVTRMGDWSPECYRCVWTNGATGPEVGARFRGYNRRGLVRWFTMPKVTRCEPGVEFGFSVPQSDAEWVYRFEADGTGTKVTETRHMTRKHSALRDKLVEIVLGGGDRDENVRQGVEETLARIKAAAENKETVKDD